jgi:hypothetical protein
MKLFYLFFFMALSSVQAQDGLFFNFGKNFSSFSYKNKSAYADKLKMNGNGQAYELGYSMPLKYVDFKTFKDFRYSASLTLNDYNGLALSSVNKLEWNTTYLGVQNTVDFQFFDSYYFFLSAKAGVNLSTILSGKQEVNNAVYNIAHQKEFSGLLFQPLIGVYAKYYLSKNGYLSLGCNMSKTVKLFNNPDRVSINTTQILFGGYFNLIKK